jgi:hypothetical protein
MTAPAPLNEVSESPTRDLVVIARNPQEMQVAQQQLVGWTGSKLHDLHTELEDVQANLAIAKKNKWRHTPYERRVKAIGKDIEYYEKIEAAVQAGYVILPNFDNLDIFAIRTTRKKPVPNLITTNSGWSNQPKNPESSRPPLGEGEYVNADAKVYQKPKTITTKEGKQEERIVRWNKEFTEVAFPFTMAKPQILDATAKAMVLKCFDDIGILPGRNRPKGDPMVIGRIWKKQGYFTKTASFLITWFVDTRDL